MKLHIFALTILLGASLLPTATQAYSTSEQTATDLGNNHALFTITYKFGFLNRDFYMPIQASRNTNNSGKSTNVSYNILFDGKTDAKATSTTISTTDANFALNYSILPGKAKGMVLSNAEIKDDQYFLPKGKTAEFTLFALVDMSKTPVKEKVSLQMTALPFTMVENGKKIDAHINPSELQNYHTPEISLNN